MLEQLKKNVFEANIALSKSGLVVLTWGNVSGMDRATGYIAIKPSGVEYSKMKWTDIVIVDLNGKVIEGDLRPSSDTATHIEIYKAFPKVGGITHTHSSYATSFAQAGTPITILGTTQADYFTGDIPVTRQLTEAEVKDGYEKNTGKVIIEAMKSIDISAVPGVLVQKHGVFTFGKDASQSVYHAIVLEECAKMAYQSIVINPNVKRLDEHILRKHYERKHGSNAYYGQTEKKK